MASLDTKENANMALGWRSAVALRFRTSIVFATRSALTTFPKSYA